MKKVLSNKNIQTLSATIFCNLTCYYTWFVILPLHLRNLGAHDLQIGIIYTVLELGFALFQVVGGILSDRFGRKNLIALPTFFFLPLLLVAGSTDSWLLLSACLFIGYSLSALQTPAMYAMLAESVGSEVHGVAFSMMEISVISGLAVGPAIGSVLFPVVGIRNLIYAAGVMGAITAVARLLWLEETKKSVTKPPSPGFLLRPVILQALVALVFFSLMEYFTIHGPFIAVYGKDVVGLSEQEINGLFAIWGGAAVLFSLLGGRIVDRVGGRVGLMAGAFLHPILLLGWLFSTTLAGGVPSIVLAAASFQLAAIARNVLLSGLVSEEHRSFLFGAAGTVSGAAGSLAPTIGMVVKERWGGTSPFLMAVLMGGGCLLSLLLVREAGGRMARREQKE